MPRRKGQVGPTSVKTVIPSRYPGDPPPRPDGACLVCSGPRSTIAIRHEDPFCSGGCCRHWYGCTVESSVTAAA